jgi:hypothetical protein
MEIGLIELVLGLLVIAAATLFASEAIKALKH